MVNATTAILGVSAVCVIGYLGYEMTRPHPVAVVPGAGAAVVPLPGGGALAQPSQGGGVTAGDAAIIAASVGAAASITSSLVDAFA